MTVFVLFSFCNLATKTGKQKQNTLGHTTFAQTGFKEFVEGLQKEYEDALVKKVEGDASDGQDEIKLEAVAEAPVQTAVYMSRVQRAKQANAARAGK